MSKKTTKTTKAAKANKTVKRENKTKEQIKQEMLLKKAQAHIQVKTKELTRWLEDNEVVLVNELEYTKQGIKPYARLGITENFGQVVEEVEVTQE